MRGVMEEKKVSRITEVIVSSVKPFQLMLGKIFGIGAVGLVQFIIWVVLVFGLQLLLPLLFPGLMGHMPQQPISPGAMGAAQSAQASGAMAGIMQGLSEINFPLIIGCFIFTSSAATYYTLLFLQPLAVRLTKIHKTRKALCCLLPCPSFSPSLS